MEDLKENEVVEESNIETDDEDVTKYFASALAKHDSDLEKEQEENKKTLNTHYAEFIAPFVCIVLTVMTLFEQFWFFAYFGLIFGGVGIFICKKKAPNIARWVLLLNVIALALCIFAAGSWIILYAAEHV